MTCNQKPRKLSLFVALILLQLPSLLLAVAEAQSPPPAPVFSPSPIAAAPAPSENAAAAFHPSTTSLSGLDTAYTGLNFDKLPWKSSIMFTPNDIGTVYDSLAIMQTQKMIGTLQGANDGQVSSNQIGANGLIPGQFLPKGTINNIPGITGKLPFGTQGLPGAANPNAVQTYPTVAPTFFLRSVLYYNPENWTIWINNEKFRKGQSTPNLQVLNVSEDGVEFLWQSTDLDFISPNWKEKFNNNAELPKTIDDLIKLDPEEEKKQAAEREARLKKKENDFFDNGRKEYLALRETEYLNTLPPGLPRDPKSVANEIRAQWEKDWEAEKLREWLPKWEVQRTEEIAAEDQLLKSEKQKKVDQIRQKQLDGLKSGDFKWNFSSKTGQIFVDSITGSVKVSLGINQTFVTRTMDVVEGFVAATPLAPPVQNAQQPPPGVLGSIQSVGSAVEEGIINQLAQ